MHKGNYKKISFSTSAPFFPSTIQHPRSCVNSPHLKLSPTITGLSVTFGRFFSARSTHPSTSICTAVLSASADSSPLATRPILYTIAVYRNAPQNLPPLSPNLTTLLAVNASQGWRFFYYANKQYARNPVTRAHVFTKAINIRGILKRSFQRIISHLEYIYIYVYVWKKIIIINNITVRSMSTVMWGGG